jgi:hypothetical protein
MTVIWGDCRAESDPAAPAFGPGCQAGSRGRRQSVRFVLAEEGTSGLEAHAPPDGGHQTVVIAQGPSEPPPELALRAVRRILALEQAHRSVERMIVLLAPRFDREATGARLLVARALMTHSAVTNGGTSELLFSAGDTPWPSLEEELFTLVDALRGDGDGWSLPIRLQLPRECQPSLFFPSARLRRSSEARGNTRSSLPSASRARTEKSHALPSWRARQSVKAGGEE